MFSKTCEYGIRAVLFIAQHSNGENYIGLKEIAKVQELPEHFLSKVLQILVRHKILKSTRGLKGGFALNNSPDSINLLSIISAIDGMDLFDTCVLGMKECSSEKPCPVHNQYKPVKEEFLRILSEKTLQNLVEDLNSGKTYIVLKQN
jgi:Rrf2 family transcriptional regulator, iron-sulfur cluster assembly transcription factor